MMKLATTTLLAGLFGAAVAQDEDPVCLAASLGGDVRHKRPPRCVRSPCASASF